MNWETIIVKVAPAYAWPLTVLIIFFALRKPLRALLASLKSVEYRDLRAAFGEELKAIAADVPIEAIARLDLRKIDSSGAAIVNAWAEVERTVLNLGKAKGLQGSSWRETLRQLQAKGVLSDKDIDSLSGLYALRNLAAYRSGEPLPKEEAAKYVAMAEAMLAVLSMKTKAP